MTTFAPLPAKVDLPQNQRLYYDQLFKIADADGDGFIGLNDSAFFRKSSLPNATLGEVWQLSDSRKEGRLDKDGFVVALSLISIAQQGKRPALDALRGGVPPPPKMVDVPPPPPITKEQNEWTVPPLERKQYLDLFRTHDDDGDGFINGTQARTLFSNSGLSLPVLGQIWTLADLNKDQRLDPHEFVLAMFLITAKKRGLELPAVLPESLISSAWPEPSSPTQAGLPPAQVAAGAPAVTKSNEWIIPPAEKVKYDDLFKKTDTDTDGLISGDQARTLFLKSGVPVSDLGRIWLLSDLNHDQKLDKHEFTIAMFLISCRLKGRDIPTPLPEQLVASARGDFVPVSTTAPPSGPRYDISLDDVAPASPAPVPATPEVTPAPAPHPEGAAGVATLAPGPQAVLEGSRRFPSSGNLHAHTQSTPNLHAHSQASPQPQPREGPQFLSGSSSVGALSPAIGLNSSVSSAPPVLQPGAQFLPALSPQFGSVQLVPSTALEIERTRQSIAHHERTKTEMTQQLQEHANVGNETARLLEEERARADYLIAEIREIEAQIGAQRARGASFKENITAIRLEVKNSSTQKDQLEQLLHEKREQCEDQEQILGELRIELEEKTNEAERLQREVELMKARLDSLRSATSETKSQLGPLKKQIAESKSELNKLTEEAKALKTSSSSSPPLIARTGSPIVSTLQPGTPSLSSLQSQSHISRTSSTASAFPQYATDTTPASSSSSPALAHLSSSNPPASFGFAPSDSFSFDNGHEDPFNFPSKDGFGLSAVTKDSFGTTPPTSTPPPTRPSPSSQSQESSAFFSSNETFGEPKDMFASSFAFGGAATEGFDFGKSEGFGSGSAGSSGSVSSVSKSVVVPPTPHNTVVGERSAGLSTNDIANAFSAAAFGGSNGTETTSTFFGTTEDSFGASSFGDSFGSNNDAFGNTQDAFAAGVKDEGLKSSGGFHENVFNRGSGGFQSSDVDVFKRGSGVFPAVDSDSFKRESGSIKSPIPSSDKDGASSPFHAKLDDSFGKRESSGSIKSPHPFSSDAFGKSDAFGSSDSFGKSDAFGKSDSFGSGDAFGKSDAFGSGDAFGKTDSFGASNDFGTSDAFGSPSQGDGFSTTDAFGSSNDGFGASSGDAFGSGDMFGKTDAFGSDAFGKSDAFGNADAFGVSDTSSKGGLTSSGGKARTASGTIEDSGFGSDVFGKADGFGTFNFSNDKKDGFDF